MERINVAVMDLNSIDMFLEYDQLAKHNSEVNWNKITIQFTIYLKEYRTQYQDIAFTSKTRRV